MVIRTPKDGMAFVVSITGKILGQVPWNMPDAQVVHMYGPDVRLLDYLITCSEASDRASLLPTPHEVM